MSFSALQGANQAAYFQKFNFCQKLNFFGCKNYAFVSLNFTLSQKVTLTLRLVLRFGRIPSVSIIGNSRTPFLHAMQDVTFVMPSLDRCHYARIAVRCIIYIVK